MGFWNLLKNIFLLKWLFGNKNKSLQNDLSQNQFSSSPTDPDPGYDDLDVLRASRPEKNFNSQSHLSYTDPELYPDELEDMNDLDYLDEDFNDILDTDLDSGYRHNDFFDHDSDSGYDFGGFHDDLFNDTY